MGKALKTAIGLGPLMAAVLALASGPSLDARRRIEGLLGRTVGQPACWRLRRGVHVLQRINTNETRNLLQKLSERHPGTSLALEATKALKSADRGPAKAQQK